MDIAAERALALRPVQRRLAAARDAYTHLHLPMIAGIMLLALGLEKVVAIIEHNELHHASAPLAGLGFYALYGGVSLSCFSHVGFQLRITRLVRRIIWPRLITAALLAGIILIANQFPAVAALGLLAAICVGLVITEVILAGGQRKELREAALTGSLRSGGERRPDRDGCGTSLERCGPRH